VSVVTFARDLFIENENGWLTKINTILKSHGENELVHLLEKNFGVDIDGWFLVNFTSVIELVDAIGGAEIELTAEEVLYLNKNAGIYPDNPLSEGLCRLNGGQALAYARCRKLDSDFARGARQGKLMQAMVAQTKKMNIVNIVNVFNSLKHAWHSSFSASEQVGLLSQAIWLRGADVERIVMPIDSWRYGNAPSGINGVLADLPENRALLREALGYPPEASAAE
jgi:LCP family protein required for cell wall assembly